MIAPTVTWVFAHLERMKATADLIQAVKHLNKRTKIPRKQFNGNG